MRDLIIGYIRTIVPTGVGLFAAWLATLGVDLDADTQAGLILGLGGTVTASFLALARALETRYPAAGWLLGYPAAPTYTTGAGAAGANTTRAL